MKEALEVVRRHHQGEITTTQLVHELDDWGVKVVGYEEQAYKLFVGEVDKLGFSLDVTLVSVVKKPGKR